MEVSNQKISLARNKSEHNILLMEDNSMVYKLKRSCDRIEQLMNEVQILKRENQLKSKLIINLQAKQRQLLSSIQSYKIMMEEQNSSLLSYHSKLVMAQVKSIQQIEMEQQYCKLKYRYANCEQENMVLRNQNKLLEHQIDLLSSQMVNTKNDANQKAIQIQRLIIQNDALYKQIAFLKHLEEELNWLKTKNIEKDVQMELQLQRYRQMIAKYGSQLQNSMKLQQRWFNNYSDLEDTVNHIQQLRQCFRIRKALK